MKLNIDFLATQWEMLPNLKTFYRESMCDTKHIDPDTDAMTKLWWITQRNETVDTLTSSPRDLRLFYLTKTVQDEAAFIKYGKIKLGWLQQVKNQHSIYVTGKMSFYRFHKKDDRINCIYWGVKVIDGKEHIWYDSFAIDFTDEAIKMTPAQDESIAYRFIQLLMYIEMGEITLAQVKINQKLRYGKGGDDKLKNESGIDNVFLVNSNWNKIIVVQGGFKVRGHFRIQACGEGRKSYKLTWVRDYEKGGYIRRAGKEVDHG